MLRFEAKVPGLGIDVRNVNMDFPTARRSGRLADAYETLLLDVLLGDASLFTRADEVEAAWGIVDPIIEAWAESAARVPELRGRLVGARGGRRAARPRRPALAPDLGPGQGRERQSQPPRMSRAPRGRRGDPARADPGGGAQRGGREFGEIIAVTRPAGGGRIELADPPSRGSRRCAGSRTRTDRRDRVERGSGRSPTS